MPTLTTQTDGHRGGGPIYPALQSRLRASFRFGAVILCLTMGTVLSYGSAFSIAELGVRAAGMGTAFIGVADDGSALFYNPAGIAFQPGGHMQMDNPVVIGLFRFTPSSTPVGQVVPEQGYPQSVRPHFIPLANLYMTQQLSPKLTIGMGIFTPFGLAANSTNFNDADPNLTKFVGRFAGTRDLLQAFWFQPTVAYRLTENNSIGIGPAIVHTHLFIEQSFLNPLDDALTFGRTAAPTIFPGQPVEQAAHVISRLLPEGRSRVAGTANSKAIAAGYLWKHPSGKTSVGLSFRSAVTSHLSGKVSFAFGTGYALEQYVGPGFLIAQFPNQPVKGSFTTPATYGVGFRHSSSFHDITIAADFRFQDYQRFQNVPLNFSINKNNADVALDPEKILKFNFRNSYNVAVGMEKALSPRLTARAGYMFDRSPVPDKSVGPFFPDSSRDSFMVGATRKSGTRELAFFYEAMNFRDRVTNVAANNNIFTNGDYHNFAHLVGLSLRFDTPEFMQKKPR